MASTGRFLYYDFVKTGRLTKAFSYIWRHRRGFSADHMNPTSSMTCGVDERNASDGPSLVRCGGLTWAAPQERRGRRAEICKEGSPARHLGARADATKNTFPRSHALDARKRVPRGVPAWASETCASQASTSSRRADMKVRRDAASPSGQPAARRGRRSLSASSRGRSPESSAAVRAHRFQHRKFDRGAYAMFSGHEIELLQGF